MSYRHLTIIVIIALCALSVQAQSGRRQTKPEPAAPVPTPTPEPTPVPKKEEKQDLLFFIGADRNTSYASIPLAYYDAVLHGCAQRLRAASSASVDVSEHDVSRGEAIKKAKSEAQSYIVLLTLSFDSMASRELRPHETEARITPRDRCCSSSTQTWCCMVMPSLADAPISSTLQWTP